MSQHCVSTYIKRRLQTFYFENQTLTNPRGSWKTRKKIVHYGIV